MERALVIGNKKELLPSDLPPEITKPAKTIILAGDTSLQTLQHTEDDMILKVLKITDGHR